MFARAGIVGIFTKKQINKKGNYLQRYYQTISEKPSHVLTYSKTPIALWIVGFLFVVAGSYLTWHIWFVVPDTLFSSFKRGTWWQYLASLSLFFFGIAFLFEGKMNQVEIDRHKDVIRVTKTNLCKRRKIQTRRASDCLSARVVKKGIDSVSTNTIHYKLILEFEDNKPLQILETESRAQIKKRYVQITDYLDLEMNLDNVPIEDQTARKRALDEKKSKAKEQKNTKHMV